MRRAWLLRHAVIFCWIFGTSASAVPYKIIFNLLDKLEFVAVFSILKQAKDKQPSLKGKVPDRADGWSVSDQKALWFILFPSLLRNEPLSHDFVVPAPLSGALTLKLSLHQKQRARQIKICKPRQGWNIYPRTTFVTTSWFLYIIIV